MVSSGVYLCHLLYQGRVKTLKLVKVK